MKLHLLIEFLIFSKIFEIIKKYVQTSTYYDITHDMIRGWYATTVLCEYVLDRTSQIIP